MGLESRLGGTVAPRTSRLGMRTPNGLSSAIGDGAGAVPGMRIDTDPAAYSMGLNAPPVRPRLERTNGPGGRRESAGGNETPASASVRIQGNCQGNRYAYLVGGGAAHTPPPLGTLAAFVNVPAFSGVGGVGRGYAYGLIRAIPHPALPRLDTGALPVAVRGYRNRPETAGRLGGLFGSSSPPVHFRV